MLKYKYLLAKGTVQYSVGAVSGTVQVPDTYVVHEQTELAWFIMMLTIVEYDFWWFYWWLFYSNLYNNTIYSKLQH